MGGNPGGLEGPPSTRFPGHLRAPPVSGEHLLCLGPSNVLAGSAGHRTPLLPRSSHTEWGPQGRHTHAGLRRGLPWALRGAQQAGRQRREAARDNHTLGSGRRPTRASTRLGTDPQEAHPLQTLLPCGKERRGAPVSRGGGHRARAKVRRPLEGLAESGDGGPCPPPGRAVRLPSHEVMPRVHSRPRPPGLRVGCAGGGPRAPTRPCG